MLGLVSSETIDDYWSQNNRRRIFYDYPNGPAPVTGLLSLAEVDSTPHPEFKWEEKRYMGIQTTTAGGPTATVVFYLAGTTTTAGTPVTTTEGQILRMYVTDASEFQVEQNIVVFGLDLTSGTGDLTGVVSTVNTDGADYIEFRVTEALYSTVLNSSDANEGKFVVSAGSAFAEGARSQSGRIQFPYEITNYTQIHKTAFELTRTAMKEPLKYDKTGAYADAFKTNGIDHLAGLEWNAFFGRRGKTTVADPSTGKIVSKRMSGGIRWFLDNYEVGADYGLTNIQSQTEWRTYTRKRVIKLGGSTISGADWDEIDSRSFEKTMTSDYSKLWVCGSGFYNKVSSYYRGKIQVTSMRDEGYEGFNMLFNKVETDAGCAYFKVHPLFNDPNMTFMRNSAFCLDMACMFWRPLTDSDTDVQKMIQENDADKRKDQFLTEGGLEIRFPEAFMYVENLGGITK